MNKRARDCAYLIGEKCLLCKLSSGDMVAIDAIYHCACLTAYYRKAESVECEMTESYMTQLSDTSICSMSYLITLKINVVQGQRTLAMYDLTYLNDKRIAALGFSHVKCNSTRLEKTLSI